MSDELENQESNSQQISAKPKRHYNRRNPIPAQLPPQIANPAIQAMELELVPFMGKRTEANLLVSKATADVNRANEELQRARDYLEQIEGEVNYRLQTIAQMKGIPFQPQYQQSQQSPYPARFGDYPQAVPASPPYQPITPFPSGPVPMGVASFPAPNRGLYPDATERIESAEDIRALEQGGIHGRSR